MHNLENLYSGDNAGICYMFLQTNTFQCVLATDGLKSFAFFLYADGEIQWTTGDASSGSGGFGGTPAHAGFDAGDGVRFALIPESDSPEIINIDTTSNVGVPGVWAFRVDGEDIAVGVCSDVDDTKGMPAIESHIGIVLQSTIEPLWCGKQHVVRSYQRLVLNTYV